MMRAWAMALTLGLWLGALGGGCAPAAPPDASLFVLITVDTLRADRLGAYGSTRGLTPHLDALAADSVVFERAYAPASFTVPSVSALMTGRYPEELGIWVNESGLPDSVPTLAGTLRERGWRTHAAVSNFVLRKASGLDSGFDRYDDRMTQFEQVRKWPERVAKDTTDAGLAMLDACATGVDTRCFVWVHYQDPHGPYTPDPLQRQSQREVERGFPDGRRKLPVQPGVVGMGGIPKYQYLDGESEVAFYRAGYNAEVAAMDAQVGRLLSGIDERGLAQRAVVGFAADHGESLGEGDYWFAHGEHLSDVLVRVPLWFRIPGHAPQRRADVVSLVDLYGSLVALLTRSPAAVDRGRDLFAPGAEQQNGSAYMATLGAARTRRFGLVSGEYKWIVSVEGERNVPALYRRGDDATNLVGQKPRVEKRMHASLEARRNALDRSIPLRRPDLPESEREKLRALGYVDD